MRRRLNDLNSVAGGVDGESQHQDAVGGASVNWGSVSVISNHDAL